LGYTDRRTFTTRNAIKEAFLLLLEETDFESITIHDITQTANYNRATFYIHFHDKEHLLDIIIDEKLEQLLSSVATLIEKEIHKINYLQPDIFITHFFSYFSKHVSFFKNVLVAHKVKLDYIYKKLYSTIYNQFSIRVVSAVGNNSVKIDTRDSIIYNAYLSSITLGLVIYWINNYTRYTPESIAKQLLIINQTKPLQKILTQTFDNDKQVEQPLVQDNKSSIQKPKSLDSRMIRSRNKMKHALISLMNQKEFMKITIREISEHSNLNRVTFYNHYQKKEDLLNEICEDIVEGLITPFKSFKGNNKKDKEKITYQAFLSFFSFVEDNYSFFKMMHSDKMPLKFYNKIYHSLFSYFRNALSKVSYFNNHALQKIDPNIFGCWATAALLGVIAYWVSNSNMKYSTIYMAKTMTIIINSTPKSLSFVNQALPSK